MRKFFKKFPIHPLFIVYAVLLVLLGQAKTLLFSILAVALHETAHYLVARRRGYRLTGLRVTPFGAVLSAEVNMPDSDLFAVAAAGPAFNLFLSLTTVALWWIFPSIYGLTLDFFYANLAIGCFNLLPLYPLDGSRIVTSFAKDKQKALRVLRVSGYVSSFVFAVLFIASIFVKVSYSLALVSVMLYLGAAFDAKNQRYVLRINDLFFLRDATKPLEKKELYVHAKTKIGALLRALKNDAVYTVKIVDDSFKTLRTLTDADLQKLFFRDRSEPVDKEKA